MKKTKTHIQERREHIEELRREVMKELEMTEEEYNQYHFDNAYRWIERNGYDYILCVLRSSLFWKWWKNTYSRMDERFIMDIEWYKANLPKEEIIFTYHYDHRTNRDTPSSSLLNRMFKEVKQKENEPQLQQT